MKIKPENEYDLLSQAGFKKGFLNLVVLAPRRLLAGAVPQMVKRRRQ